jgi:hypothetical protein
MKLDKINKLFNKNPSILKLILKYQDGVPDHKILHVSYIIKDNQNALKNLKLVYSQYQSFDDFYKALLLIEDTSKNHSSYCNKETLIAKFEESDTPFIECSDGNLIIEVDTYQKMKEYGSPNWCIFNNDKYFKLYTKNGQKKQYILFDFSNKHNPLFRIGITAQHTKKGSKISSVSNDDNQSFFLDDSHINKVLPQNNTLNLFNFYTTTFSLLSSFDTFIVALMLIFGFTIIPLMTFSIYNQIDSNRDMEDIKHESMDVRNRVNNLRLNKNTNTINAIGKIENIISEHNWKIDIQNNVIFKLGIHNKTCLKNSFSSIKVIDMREHFSHEYISKALSFASSDNSFDFGCIMGPKDTKGGNLFYTKLNTKNGKA